MEKPTLDVTEQQKPTETQQADTSSKPSGDEDVKALIEKLSAIGVKKPEEIDNLKLASSQAGRLANELGEVRQYNQRLERMLAEVQTQLKKKPASEDSYNSDGGQSIDLGAMLDQKLDGAIKRNIMEMRKQELDAMNAQQRAVQEIQRDEYFPMVKDVWQAHLQNYDTIMALQNGQTTLKDEYYKVVMKTSGELLRRTKSVLEKTSTERSKAPTVEMDGKQSIQMPSKPEEWRKQTQKIVEARQSGQLDSDRALDALVKQFLPADDPIFRR